MAHVKKNDKVRVISGKHKGKEGKILKIDLEKKRAIVERINFVKRHTRGGTKIGQHGGIIEKEAPLPLAKLILVCPKCSKPARTGIEILEGKTRVRYCKKCNEQVDG